MGGDFLRTIVAYILYTFNKQENINSYNNMFIV